MSQDRKMRSITYESLIASLRTQRSVFHAIAHPLPPSFLFNLCICNHPFDPLFRNIWDVEMCMLYLLYPSRWHDLALSTLLAASQEFNITSVRYAGKVLIGRRKRDDEFENMHNNMVQQRDQTRGRGPTIRSGYKILEFRAH